MKRIATKTLVMTAALAAFAVGASAQSMNAEIPFPFRAGSAVLAAGSYRVNAGLGDTVLRLTNLDTKKSVILTARYHRDADRKWSAGNPKMWFVCTGSSCVLTTLWNGADPTAVVIGGPDGRGKGIAETRVVTLSLVKTE